MKVLILLIILGFSQVLGQNSEIIRQGSEKITERNIHILQQHLVSIKNGGEKMLHFSGGEIMAYSDYVCENEIIGGICNFGISSCEVRNIYLSTYIRGLSKFWDHSGWSEADQVYSNSK